MIQLKWTFSPLFIAAMVATKPHRRFTFSNNPLVRFSSRQWLLLRTCRIAPSILVLLSVRFSSGHGLLQIAREDARFDQSFFQSPFHRGMDCYPHTRNCFDATFQLSVPFSSGHGLLLSRSRLAPYTDWPFSPLFIGAWTATTTKEIWLLTELDLLVPFSSGHGLLHCTENNADRTRDGLSVPFSSGHGLLRILR